MINKIFMIGCGSSGQGLLELWIDELDNPKQYKGLKKAIEKKENSNNFLDKCKFLFLLSDPL